MVRGLSEDNRKHLAGYTTIGFRAVEVHRYKKVRKASELTFLKVWIGRTVIYQCGPQDKPMVAYVSRVTDKGGLRGQYLNSSIAFFGKPKFCVEYTPRLLNRLLFAYQYRANKKTLQVLKKRLKRGLY